VTVRLSPRGAAISLILASLAGRAAQVRAQEKDTVFHAPILVGKVHEASGAGIPSVRVSAKASGQTALSDSTGRFVLRGLDTGHVAFSVRRIGFEPSEFTVSLDSGETFTLDLTLNQSVVQLTEVDVNADSRIRDALRQFYRHKESEGGGVFIVRADIEKSHAQTLSDVVRRVPGLVMIPSHFFGADGVRMARNTGGRDCPVVFWLDGARAPWLNLDDIAPMNVEAIEIYRGAATLPAEYNDNKATPACGTIAIWTRVPGN
jgi:carboxypeptidase family protein/TonB-dependent receptor-like protein